MKQIDRSNEILAEFVGIIGKTMLERKDERDVEGKKRLELEEKLSWLQKLKNP